MFLKFEYLQSERFRNVCQNRKDEEKGMKQRKNMFLPLSDIRRI